MVKKLRLYDFLQKKSGKISCRPNPKAHFFANLVNKFYQKQFFGGKSQKTQKIPQLFNWGLFPPFCGRTPDNNPLEVIEL